MRELIRHILKENNIKQELKKVIEDDNIFKAADLVGGMSNLKRIFKDSPEVIPELDQLKGTIIFYYYDIDKKHHVEFPLDYEIIGRASNNWGTNHWPKINVFYDESKLTPIENKTLKYLIKSIYNDAQISSYENKFNDYKLFNSNYFAVKEINGEFLSSVREYDLDHDVIKGIYHKLYDESESLNENINSEIDKNLKVINVLLSLVSWDGLCDIWAEYNPDDKEYEIRSKTVTSNDLGASIFEIEEELQSLHNSIRSMGIRAYIYTPWYVDNCEDEVEFMNESEDKQERKFTKLLNTIEEYINSNSYDSVVRTMVDYDEVMDDVIVNIFFDVEKARELGGGINSVIKRTGKKIKEDLSVFPFDFKYYIHFDGPQLNESENKEQSLQKLIDQYGLYVFMKMTGLDFNQVKSILNKMGNPKELLKQYISEFVLEKGGSTGENYGSLFALQIPLSDTKYVEDILVHGDDSIAVEIWEFHLDEYGHREQKDQYLTTINNLTNEELLSIISWMMEIVEGGYWD